MDNKEQQSMAMRAFFLAIKKMFTNFNEGMLSAFAPAIHNIICNEKGEPIYDKFSPDDNYKNVLDAYCVIMALKQSNSIYNAYYKQYNMDTNKRALAAAAAKKPPVKIPEGWRVIQGGKSRTV